ncbi:hypothetical protein HPP92_016221 [Vanilla planifolia]|uniref:NAC domain-containing protein n=1 Tax=Vanilla planifolia TaxID=51239 RepID=A0A835QJM6_VANPL|nr:hypothetical protein HPP92_016221 [Vanilla planifolia]
MEEHFDMENGDEVMLPGFRFHPTDEELVGFYLWRKIQQKLLSFELIRPLDIYKYDPWDLPKLATMGEREWYFFCPRDRKYRNSTRPNRVTGAGFWKATGTDRPVYSTEGTKCIGLKKSLVFYRGRAAMGIKTDWMMHEFRLPPIPKRPSEKNTIPANESWAVCRIFKKSSASARRGLHHPWMPSFQESSENVGSASPLLSFGDEIPTSLVLETLLPASTLRDVVKPPQSIEANGIVATSPLEANTSLVKEEENLMVDSCVINDRQWEDLRMVPFPFYPTTSNPSDEREESLPWDYAFYHLSDMPNGY